MSFQDRLKELFIPCTENGYKPNFLERLSVGIMLVLIVLSFTLANLQALLWMGSEWMVSTILPAVIVDLTNGERVEERVGALRRNEILDRAAQLKAEDMATHEYFSHYSPTGVSPWYWFDEVSYNFVHAGENLAVHFTDSSDVVAAWMKSPGHRANILNGDYAEIGVGTARGEYKGFPTIFVVQLFGTPSAVSTEPIPVVASASLESQSAPQITLETVTEPDTQPSFEEDIAPATIVTDAEAMPEPQSESILEFEPPVAVVAVDNTNNDVLAEEIKESQAEGNTISLYSDLATTSRAGIPATTESMSGGDVTTPETNLFERSATQPGVWLQAVYSFLAGIVVISLLLSIFIEWRRQHPIQIAYAGGLLAVMAILFYMHTALTSGVIIV
jgi:hypothetical protein